MKISGRILDIDNEPLIGANITLRSGSKAGKFGTISDFDGNFSLESDTFTETDVFEVSYIGFVKQRFTANELQDKKIILQESITQLDDLVITATKPKNNLTKSKQNSLKEYLSKNKYAYAGVSGLLGLGLIIMSIKNK